MKYTKFYRWGRPVGLAARLRAPAGAMLRSRIVGSWGGRDRELKMRQLSLDHSRLGAAVLRDLHLVALACERLHVDLRLA